MPSGRPRLGQQTPWGPLLDFGCREPILLLPLALTSTAVLDLGISVPLLLQKADAEMAYELQAAKTKQRIKDEQMMIKVVERTQEILVQEQEIQRRERELDSTIRRPADAEKFRLEKIAEANKNR